MQGDTETMPEACDVVICGSGAAGMLAAVRLHDLGLEPLVIEKSARFGGTSAISGGGIWVPCHGQDGFADSREDALAYLGAVSKGAWRAERVEAYVDSAPLAARYLSSIGVAMTAKPEIPDYLAAPGATSGRSLFPLPRDGSALGEDFHRLREAPETYRLLGRIAMNLDEALALGWRRPGWIGSLARLIARYGLDLPWRLRTRHDRRLTMGRALTGGLRRAMQERGLPLRLNCALARLVVEDGTVRGVEVAARGGGTHRIAVRHGVILAAGGHEQSQKLRDAHMPVATDRAWSLTPVGMNVGDALEQARQIGADSEFLDANWWAPSILVPSRKIANLDVAEAMYFDNRHPFSMCVNRQGQRFANECASYDSFGQAMIDDQRGGGENLPCWMVFDATFRQRYSCGPILPQGLMPDRRIPPEWWDSVIFKAGDLRELAGKTGIDADGLAASVERFNAFARSGSDEDFGRGAAPYDRYFGRPDVKPNPCLGALEAAPFYAVRIELGDLGTKGGLKTDGHGRVLSVTGEAIGGLYAVGNSAGSPFGDCYPGAGGTLGPAVTFAWLAANHIAQMASPRAT